MARTIKRLTAKAVSNQRTPGMYADGGGLYLQVTSEAARSWVFRYSIDGRERYMGLGSVNDISLAEARDSAAGARKLKQEGGDPIAAKEQKRSAALLARSTAYTFKRCAEDFIKERESQWRNSKHRVQWRNTLSTYVYPHIGDMGVADIDTAAVLRCVGPIWTTKPETAGRVRGRIEQVLDCARALGYRSGDNPARYSDHLKHVLSERGKKSKRVKHHPAMPYRDLPGFMGELRQRGSMSAKALEYLILCASRTGEVTGAKWPEIDLDAAVWTVPADRMKGEIEHRVPLSGAAIELLRGLPRLNDYVFPGARKDSPLSNMAMLELLRGMRDGIVVHGFRSTFRDWASETSHRNDVVELALAHVNKDKVEAAYKRGDLLAMRKPLMEDWATYCAGERTGENVIPMRAVAQ